MSQRPVPALTALTALTARSALLAALLASLIAPLPLHAREAPASVATWALPPSDVPVDPQFVFGRLPNGMRYALRENHTPEGTVLVRLRIGSGSLEETDAERGMAHFLEHMAFNGSRRVPEGEMVRLLEREGLAFGADTNAATGFHATTYKLDLPRNQPRLIDTALMLMRETADGLTLSDAAIAREKGVVLAERRDRTNYGLKQMEDEWAFSSAGARFAQRLPIGTEETIRAADAAALRSFYARTYTPAKAVLIVVGAIDVRAVEAQIRARFSDWRGPAAPSEPEAGPIDLTAQGQTDIYLDPALSERVTVSRLGAYVAERDTIAQRRLDLLKSMGYAVINRRLAALSRQADPPFVGAGSGAADVFRVAQRTSLIVDTTDGGWQRALTTAAREWRRALEFGFTDAEIAEQVARQRTAQDNAAASAATRTHGALVGAIEALIADDMIPSTPQSARDRFAEFAPSITPAAVLAALKADAIPLDNPLIRFQGRVAPAGGAAALRAAWDAAMAEPLSPPAAVAALTFGYTDFGPPGAVVADRTDPRFGIRTVRFANGVRLNLKQTDLERDRIYVSLALDGGGLLNTRDDPLATALVPSLLAGGLGKHTQDELVSLTAGRTVAMGMGVTGDRFAMGGVTTPRDLELQLQLLAAQLTDPGYRREGEVRYRRDMANWFKRRNATPQSAMGAAIGGILSDGDPRFTTQPPISYQRRSFAKLREAVGDRFAKGAIEIGLVGDFDPAAAIALVGRTFGALPAREPEFQPREAARVRGFTDQRQRFEIHHTGEPDQALVRFDWPTADDRDAVLATRLEMLERVVRLELTDELRELLGKSYSPGASSNASHVWRDYGTFTVSASVNVADIAETEAAIRAVVAWLAATPVSADTIDRARRPMIEAHDNALKANAGWMRLVSRAQGDSDAIDRFVRFRADLLAVTPAQLQAVAARYLAPAAAVETVALPAPRASAAAPAPIVNTPVFDG